MNFFMRIALLCTVFLFLQISTSQAAVMTCAQMEVTSISATSLWAKNVSGSACGAVLDQKQIYLVMNPSNVDRLLAISLTAMSLQSTVWVHSLDDVNGSIVDIISLKK